MPYEVIKQRCWQWHNLCRRNADKSVRLGSHVFHHCPDHPVFICKADEKEAKA